MDSAELARENHAFFTMLPMHMFSSPFDQALSRAATAAEQARSDGHLIKDIKEPFQYGWGEGYLAITAEAAQSWQQANVDSMAFGLSMQRNVSGELNDQSTVTINDAVFVVCIEDYETDHFGGWQKVDTPLDLPATARLDRRAVIRMKES